MIQLKKIISTSTSISLAQPSTSILQDASIQCPSPIKESSKLFLHPKPNEMQFVFPVREGANAMIPSLFISQSQLHGNDVFNVRFSMKTITDEYVEINIFLPPSEMNSRIPIDAIEEEALVLAEKRGIYEGKMFNGLRNTFSAGLVGVVYPNFDREKCFDATVHIDNLFAVDDMYDSGTPIPLDRVNLNFSYKNKVISELSKLEDDIKINEYLEKLKESSEYSNLTYAYAEEFLKQKKNLQALDMDLKPFIKTLDSYFKSVIAEKKFEEASLYPSEKQCTEIRADASGAVHAVTMGASFSGIDLAMLEEKYYYLKHMKTHTARCVEFSNDIYSLYKEHLVLTKTYALETLTDIKDNLDKIRDSVAFNIVQILWKRDAIEGLNKAINDSVIEHNRSLGDYFQIKSIVIDELIVKKQLLEEVIELNSEDKGSHRELDGLKKDLEDINTYCQIMEGWLAHGWWAFSVPAYNVGITPCNQERLLALQDLQREVMTLDK